MTKAFAFFVLSLGLGVVAALGLAPFHHWYATLAALAAVFGLVKVAPSPRRGAWLMWAFGLGYFGFGLRWILEPFQIEAEIFGWMAPFGLALMSGGLALFWAAAGWIGGRLKSSFALAVALSAMEFVRAYIFTGFPWAGLAQIWIDTVFAQILALVGPHGLGLLTALVACAVWLKPRTRLELFSTALIPMSLLLVLGLSLAQPEIGNTGQTVRVVQPNAPQHEKWDPELAYSFFWRQVRATQAATPPDFVVWPETAIPQLLNHADQELDIVADAGRGAPVVLGIQREIEGRYYNALVTVGQDAEILNSYDKHHLVPFGEYMPFAPVFRRLGIRGLAERADTGYSAGPGPEIIEVAGLRALPLICYEAVFPQHSRSRGPRPDVIVQITNDAWFGTSSGPQQHLVQSRMRAIEQGLPMIRSANTGISAVIDPFGRVTKSLPLGQRGYFDQLVPSARTATLYSRTADWLAALVILVLLLICARLRGH